MERHGAIGRRGRGRRRANASSSGENDEDFHILAHSGPGPGQRLELSSLFPFSYSGRAALQARGWTPVPPPPCTMILEKHREALRRERSVRRVLFAEQTSPALRVWWRLPQPRSPDTSMPPFAERDYREPRPWLGPILATATTATTNDDDDDNYDNTRSVPRGRTIVGDTCRVPTTFAPEAPHDACETAPLRLSGTNRAL